MRVDFINFDEREEIIKTHTLNGLILVKEENIAEGNFLHFEAPSELDLLGTELTLMKLERTQDKQLIDTLGQDLAKAKLDIMIIKGMA